jgi:excinuclease UvrABC ATPase subunit
MNRKFAVIMLLFVFAFAMSSYAEDHKFIGADKCKSCHKSEKKGNQYGQWAESAHAKAYGLLTSAEGKAKAKELGIEDATASDKCLSCHTTAGTKKAMWDKTYNIEEGVGCESCHGAGSDYKSMKIMKDREKSIANGMLVPDEKTCATCHKADTPGHKGTFNFKESWEKIKHPNPQNKS